MIDLELSDVSRRVVEDLADVSADEEVAVITDPENVTIAKSLASAARATGASANLVVMPLRESHGNEPSPVAAAAMEAADVAFTATTHAITHTRSRLAASESGTRVVVLRGMTPELMRKGGMNTDYDRLREFTGAVRDVLDAADSARVTAPAGTDVDLDLTDCPAFSLDGFFHEYGFSALTPGEAPTSPRNANGRVVVDYSMDNIGLLDEPIELTFEEGTVAAVDDGVQADELRRIIAEADENGGNIAELAIGTNPDARLVGTLAEDKKRLGTVHFAVGDDESLGGSHRSDIHLDGLVLKPTVELDGVTYVDEGDVDEELIRERAAERS